MPRFQIRDGNRSGFLPIDGNIGIEASAVSPGSVSRTPGRARPDLRILLQRCSRTSRGRLIDRSARPWDRSWRRGRARQAAIGAIGHRGVDARGLLGGGLLGGGCVTAGEVQELVCRELEAIGPLKGGQRRGLSTNSAEPASFTLPLLVTHLPKSSIDLSLLRSASPYARRSPRCCSPAPGSSQHELVLARRAS